MLPSSALPASPEAGKLAPEAVNGYLQKDFFRLPLNSVPFVHISVQFLFLYVFCIFIVDSQLFFASLLQLPIEF